MRGVAVLSVAVSMMIVATGLSQARENSLKVDNAWARETAPTATSGAIFITIANGGNQADRLIAASSPAARVTELHTHIMEDDVMKMRPVEAIDVAAGEEVLLKPGGNHIMLIGLTDPLVEGSTLPLELTFETAGTVMIDVTVEDITFTGPEGGHGDHHNDSSHKH